ncbi:MAG: hypothetical protein ASARMPREDX12_006486 [Alectoria sarmentosa]|nr:MAG: hypothetical protein ASARMPREDX12_006486 [Alectoria sarmentosa]
MPSLPSLTSSENPSNSDTTLDKESVTNNVSSAMDDANEKSGSSAAAETKAGVAQSASEVEKAANKLYEENIEDERKDEGMLDSWLRRTEMILCSIMATAIDGGYHLQLKILHKQNQAIDSFISSGHTLAGAVPLLA